MNSRTRRGSRGPQLGDRVVLAISGTVVLIAAGLIVNSVNIAASSPVTRNDAGPQPKAKFVTQSPAASTPQQSTATVKADPTPEPTKQTIAPSEPVAVPKPVQPKPTMPAPTTTAPKPVVKPKPVVTPKPATTTVAVNPGSTRAKDLVTLTNQRRVAAGLKPLVLDACLNNKVAQPWALTMSTTGVLKHRNFEQIFPLCPSFSKTGENIAINQRGVAGVVDQWMKSTQYRANVLNPNYTRIGVGIHTNAQGQTYWVQNFAG